MSYRYLAFITGRRDSCGCRSRAVSRDPARAPASTVRDPRAVGRRRRPWRDNTYPARCTSPRTSTRTVRAEPRWSRAYGGPPEILPTSSTARQYGLARTSASARAWCAPPTTRRAPPDCAPHDGRASARALILGNGRHSPRPSLRGLRPFGVRVHSARWTTARDPAVASPGSSPSPARSSLRRSVRVSQLTSSSHAAVDRPSGTARCGSQRLLLERVRPRTCCAHGPLRLMRPRLGLRSPKFNQLARGSAPHPEAFAIRRCPAAHVATYRLHAC